MMSNRIAIIIVIVLLTLSGRSHAQRFSVSEDMEEVGETMKEFIKDNHIDDIENMVHKFTSSQLFIDYLLDEGHHIDARSRHIDKHDVEVGQDIDIYVKHFSTHQNFTMLLVPVNIKTLAVTDTLLFSVLEVSDKWLEEKYYSYDVTDDSVKSGILAIENHELLTNHMYEQILMLNNQRAAEIQVKLHESYITTNHITLNTNELDKNERKRIIDSWGFLKRSFTHNLELNVEMNIYIFGHDAMEVIQYLPGDKQITYKITPNNIFKRHHFAE